MSWRPHGHVRVNARSPAAAGVCYRCGRMFQRNTLRWQFDWRGKQLQNLRILVCDSGCYDKPNEQLRARILSPDPVPIYIPSPEPFAPTGVSYDSTNYMTSDDGKMMLNDATIPMVADNNATGNTYIALESIQQGPLLTEDGGQLWLEP